MHPLPYSAEARFKSGDTLAGRYRLSRLLGEGGMGYVWEGRQITTDKPVAIKILKETNVGDAARFVREARLSASLSHRNIVQVFDFWESEGGGPIFMVMELLRGETLGQYLARAERLSIEETRAVGLAVADAMRAAHAVGIVHRDLKPENVYLVHTENVGAPEIKVLDFGIARAPFVDAQPSAFTRTGSVIGTPSYMAPEQVFGERDIDGRVDVWSLGVVLYECLSGSKPFDGENFGQIFRKITQGEVVPLSKVVPEVPASFSDLVMSMLSVDRTQRPTSAAIHDALARAAALGPAPQQVQFTQWLSAPPRSSPRVPSSPSVVSSSPSFSPSSPQRPPPWTPPHVTGSGMDRTGPPVGGHAVPAASAARARQPWPSKTIAIVIGAIAAVAAVIGVVSTMGRTSSQPVDFNSLAVPTAPAASEALPVVPATSAAPLHLPSGDEPLAKAAPPPSPSANLATVPSSTSTKDDVLSGPRMEPGAPPPKARATTSPATDPLSGGRF